MTISKRIFSSNLIDSTNNIANDIIGQLKAWLLYDSNFTVISDNNPGLGPTARVLVMKYGNCAHYLQISASGTQGNLVFAVRNIANTGNIVVSTLSNYWQNQTVQMIHSSNGFACEKVMTNSDWIVFTKGSDGDFYIWLGATCYLNSSDSTFSTTIPGYKSYADSNDKLLLGSPAIYLGNNLVCYFLHFWSNQLFTGGVLYYEGVNNYFGTNGGLAVSDNS